ncbi:MAG: TrkH family potassium uptake protein, partial [Planctomycetota bacterium]
MRIGIIAKALGALLLLLVAAGALPLIADAWAGQPITPWLVMLAAYTGIGGGLLWIGRRSDPSHMGIREGIAVTALIWLLASFIAGFSIELSTSASLVDGWFESMSGFTTTGSSVFGGDRPIEELTPGVLLWRALMQWMGGIGIVVISLALLPLLVGGSGFQVYRAEVPGIDADRLAPRIRDTARILFGFYLLLTGLVFISLLACGIGGFDAACHALTTVATGGFSTFDNSIEGLNSAAAEWVVIGGMLAAGINFGLLIQALRGRPLRVWQSPETRLYLLLIGGSWLLLTLIVGLGAAADGSSPVYHDDSLHNL